MEWLLNLLFADCFQSIRTADPVLNEKRLRERRLLMSIAAMLGSVFFVVLMLPSQQSVAANSPFTIVRDIQEMFAEGGLVATLIAMAWSVAEMVGYWRFGRRVGM